jgi:phosphonate transport system permease protein
MGKKQKALPLSKKSLPILLSILVPGSGLFMLGKRWTGVVVFLATFLSLFLVNWALVDQGIGQITINDVVTTWLWIPLIFMWIWNVLYTRNVAAGRSMTSLPAIIFIALMWYVIAWNVTQIRLEPLIQGAGDAKTIVNMLINPQLATVNVNGEDQACSWGCVLDFYGAKLAGRTPAQDVKVSSDLLDIFGRITTIDAPQWQIKWGLAQKGQQVTIYETGKMVETIAIGLLATLFSTILAFPISFLAAHNIMSRFPGGTILYYLVRGFLNIVRAVDTVAWGLIIVVWVGLGPFAGVIALTIHSIAALGKLLSEEIEHIDTGPVEALTATGANLVQTIRYGIIPQIIPSFLSYTLLRWDINMRSATVIGFVAGGGIGFFVVETVRMGAYQLYATALWITAIVIILVDFISSRMRQNVLKDQPMYVEPTQRRKFWTTARKAFYGVLALFFFIYFWDVCQISLKDLFSPAANFVTMVRDFVSISTAPDVMSEVVRGMLVTIFQALLATTVGALIALPFSFLAARNLTGRSQVLAWLYYISRSIFNVLRSIEALLYVAIFVAWVGIGPFAGIMALAVTTFALIGKLFSEAIENIDPGTIEAVRATGANMLQVIYFAILPQIVPAFVSYLIYQWDINIRMATIIGFAGGGGIGLTLYTYFNSLQYHKAGTVILFIVIIVALMDFTSAKIREQLV